MLQGFLDALRVVDDDVGAVLGVFAGVHKDSGNVTSREIGDHGWISFGGHDGGAVHFALDHAANAFDHALGFVVGVGDDDFEAFLNCLVFKMFYKFGEEWIGDVGDDEAEHAGAAGDEGSRVRVGVEIQFLDGFLNALGGAGTDFVRTINGARDGSGGNLCKLGDFFDVH